MNKYTFTITVGVDRVNEDLLWDAEDEAEDMGAWPPAVCAEDFSAAYFRDYGVKMTVLKTAFTGDESNT